jgi:hypothetical protein
MGKIKIGINGNPIVYAHNFVKCFKCDKDKVKLNNEHRQLFACFVCWYSHIL